MWIHDVGVWEWVGGCGSMMWVCGGRVCVCVSVCVNAQVHKTMLNCWLVAANMSTTTEHLISLCLT